MEEDEDQERIAFDRFMLLSFFAMAALAGLCVMGSLVPDPPRGMEQGYVPAEPRHVEPPPGWTHPPGTNLAETAPAWPRGMERLMAPDDPHRELRLRVGCDGPQQRISVWLGPLQPDSRVRIHVETLGREGVFSLESTVNGYGFARFPDSLEVLAAMRAHDVHAVMISTGTTTYGLPFDVRELGRVLRLPPIEECTWAPY